MDKVPFKKTRKSLGGLLQQFRVVVSSLAEETKEAISEARKDYESRKKPKNKES